MSRFVFFLPVLRQRQTTGQKYDDFVCDRLRSGDFVFTAGTVFFPRRADHAGSAVEQERRKSLQKKQEMI